MANEVRVRKEKLDTEGPSAVAAAAESASACHMHASDWLKGSLTMAICCAAPLLLVAAVGFFGLSLGAIASGALSLGALLACPIGMLLMMRMMMKAKE